MGCVRRFTTTPVAVVALRAREARWSTGPHSWTTSADLRLRFFGPGCTLGVGGSSLCFFVTAMPSGSSTLRSAFSTPKHAAPTLVRAPVREPVPASAGSSSSATPAPRKKKVVKKVGGKKKGASYDSARAFGDGTGEEQEVDNEQWLEEQRKLTQMMNKMYASDYDGGSGESDPDEDHLEYYDYEAEEKALAARVAELKRVSSLPLGSTSFSPAPFSPPAAASGGSEDAATEEEEEAIVDVTDESPPQPPMTPRAMREAEKAATRAAAAAASRAFSSKANAGALTPRGGAASHRAAASTPRESTPELEPFCIGRRPNDFEEIEITLPSPSRAAAASSSANAPAVAPLAAGMAERAAKATADAPAEPPLTPRSLASSIAARRQANHKLRAEHAAKVTSPTGAS